MPFSLSGHVSGLAPKAFIGFSIYCNKNVLTMKLSNQTDVEDNPKL